MHVSVDFVVDCSFGVRFLFSEHKQVRPAASADEFLLMKLRIGNRQIYCGFEIVQALAFILHALLVVASTCFKPLLDERVLEIEVFLLRQKMRFPVNRQFLLRGKPACI